MSDNPCIKCGACCACFRVAFHWSEAEPFLNGSGEGLRELTVKLDRHRVAMRGTEGGQPIRCIALEGQVGTEVRCGVYAQRPSPCRELRPDGLDGRPSGQCRQARARFGLPPLPSAHPQSPHESPAPHEPDTESPAETTVAATSRVSGHTSAQQ